MKASGTPPTPTQFWTALSTMLTASNSPAKACAAPAPNRTRRLDQTTSPVRQKSSASEHRHPGGIIPLRWAASSRNPGRHYPVIDGRLRRNRHPYASLARDPARYPRGA